MDTLVLSDAYEPVACVGWQRAITLLCLGKVEVVEAYEDRTVRAVTVAVKVPSVVRFVRRVARRRHRGLALSRENVLARDGGACQYCGRKLTRAEATFDHVVPRSQGGATDWTNIVTCCHECNRVKGGRTPRQAGMQLRALPVQPNWVPAVTIRVSLRSVPDAWRDYLYWTGELDRA